MTSSTVLRPLRSLLAILSASSAPALVLSVAGLLSACKSQEEKPQSSGQPAPAASAQVTVATATPRVEAAAGPIGRDRKFPGSVLVFDVGPDGEKVERWLSAAAAEAAAARVANQTKG